MAPEASCSRPSEIRRFSIRLWIGVAASLFGCTVSFLSAESEATNADAERDAVAWALDQAEASRGPSGVDFLSLQYADGSRDTFDRSDFLRLGGRLPDGCLV